MRKIKIDHQYIAYLLLEMLYKEGKVNKTGIRVASAHIVYKCQLLRGMLVWVMVRTARFILQRLRLTVKARPATIN